VKRFSASRLRAIEATKYFYVRAGDEHRFTPVWVVVVDGRVLVRPWNDKAGGWRRALLADPRGAVRIGEREVPVRAKPVTSAKLNDLMDAAYARKYTTGANEKYVRGFATTKRRSTTLELIPA
jgi:hypothetical protein